MNLLKTLEELIREGYQITFNSLFAMFAVRLINKDGITKESHMPLEDHFNEKKIVDCLTFMKEGIKKQVEEQSIIKIMKDGTCEHCFVCPLGRIGSQLRCTEKELNDAGVKTQRT